MNWHSETAVVWLPKHGRAYPSEFASRTTPGSNDFFYYALDAFSQIYDQRGAESNREPWAYVLETQLMLSPDQIDSLKAEWETEMRLERQTDNTSTVVPVI